MAAHYALQSKAADQLMQALCSAVNAAEAARAAEERAALRIQSARRRHYATRAFRTKLYACRRIQKVYRGYRGRVRSAERRVESVMDHQRRLFDHFAALIQKSFRGYYSRKWVSDFYAQRRYIRDVEERSQQVREMTCAYEQQRLREEEETVRQRQQDAFGSASKSLRHLCSTAAQHGVLRPAAVTAGVPLRPELQATFGASAEDALRSTAVQKRRFKPDLPAKQPSLQASSRYDAPAESDKLGRRLDKRLRIAGGFLVGRVPADHYQPSIRQGDEAYGKPVKLRSHLSSATRVSAKPFMTAVARDRGFDSSCELSKLPKWATAGA